MASREGAGGPIAGHGLTSAAHADTAEPGSLQSQVNAIEATGDVGVVAEVTDRGRHGFATVGLADIATKTFVATVVLQLAGERRLSLDDTVARWLPGVVSGHGNAGSKITIRELLQHTSGIYDSTDDLPETASTADFLAGRYTTYTPDQLVATAMQHAPDFAPGAGWEYSNINYVLLGMIINQVTGHSWRDEVDTTALNPSIADAAGEIISTTADLTTFYTALMRGRLLAPPQLAAMENTVPAPELAAVWPGARYGLGLLWIPLSCGGGYFAHGGDIIGYSTRDGITPNGSRVAVVERTGDGDAPALGSEQAMNKLVDQELCMPDV